MKIEPMDANYDEPDSTRRAFKDQVLERVQTIAGDTCSVTTPATIDTEFAVRHKLGRKPTEFELVTNDLGGVVYRSSPRNWTNSVAYFKYTKGQDPITLRLR